MSGAVLIGLAVGAGVLIVFWPREAHASIDYGGGGELPAGDAGGSWLDNLFSTSAPTDTGDGTSGSVDYSGEGYTGMASEDANVAAFLQMIRVAEGTAGPLGYQTMFGGSTFDDFSDHPRIANRATFKGGKTVTSTAAGAYQFLARTWDGCQVALGLPDFSPASQDAAAVYLIKRRGALDDVKAGRLAEAVRKCNREWASLPGSPYGQPTISLDRCYAEFEAHGGTATA